MYKILVFNVGSSTIKYKIFEFEKKNDIYEIQSGFVDNIGLEFGPNNHAHALSLIFKGISLSHRGLCGIPGLIAIGHRVVHCGDSFEKTTRIDEDVIKSLKKFNLVAPLHNPKIIEVMEQVIKHSGKSGHRAIPNYAVFDSVFYKDLPKVAKIYPLPYKYYQEYGIKKFGFHGISHQYATENILSRHKNAKKIITIHLGAGSSITASVAGKPIDTSMGFTPLEGLMMVTRSGNIDAGIIHYLIELGYLSHKEVDNVLNFESGMVGITGLKSDMTNFLNIAGYKVEKENFKPSISPASLSKDTIERVKLAIDMYVYRIKKYIGEYHAILGGIDVLAFTGKIGYGSSVIRKMVIDKMDHILKHTVVEAIETDEELQIAKEIIKVIKN